MQAPRLTCALCVNTDLKGWQKTLTKIFQDIEDLLFSIDLPNKLMYIEAQVDPVIFIKKLYKARFYALLYRIDYGYEKNPQGTRKPNSHFMRGRFVLDTLERTWFKKFIRALLAIQGVSFTIDSPTQTGYLFGNIEPGVLMKMLTKTGIKMYTIDYGVEDKDSNLNPPAPKKLEAPPNGIHTQAAKETDPPPPPPPPPPPQVASISTKHQVTYRKYRGFSRLFCF